MNWFLPVGLILILLILIAPIDTGQGSPKFIILVELIKWIRKKLKK